MSAPTASPWPPAAARDPMRLGPGFGLPVTPASGEHPDSRWTLLRDPGGATTELHVTDFRAVLHATWRGFGFSGALTLQMPVEHARGLASRLVSHPPLRRRWSPPFLRWRRWLPRRWAAPRSLAETGRR